MASASANGGGRTARDGGVAQVLVVRPDDFVQAIDAVRLARVGKDDRDVVGAARANWRPDRARRAVTDDRRTA
jgi:hypothetical protein